MHEGSKCQHGQISEVTWPHPLWLPGFQDWLTTSTFVSVETWLSAGVSWARVCGTKFSIFLSLSLSYHWRWNFLNHLFITLSDDKYHNIHLEPAIMSVYSDLKPHWNTTIYMSLSVNFPKGHSGGQQQAQVALERTQKQAWLSHAPCDVVMYSHYAS